MSYTINVTSQLEQKMLTLKIEIFSNQSVALDETASHFFFPILSTSEVSLGDGNCSEEQELSIAKKAKELSSVSGITISSYNFKHLYFSESKNDFIPMSQMNIFHLINALAANNDIVIRNHIKKHITDRLKAEGIKNIPAV